MFYTLIGTLYGKIAVIAKSQSYKEIGEVALFNRKTYGNITLITSPSGGLEFSTADFNVVTFTALRRGE